MVVPVAGPVEPPNFAWRGCRRQCVKHGQNRCRSDTCAKQNNGPITRSKSETAPWCARVQYVADSYVTMHVGTRQAVQLLLDTNSIVICAWHVGERITAQKLWPISNLDDLVACPDFALLQHAKVKSWFAARSEQSRHLRLVHPDAHSVTSDARLGYLEKCSANPVSVANANVIVSQALNGEVLPELSVGEIAPAEPILPIPIRLDLVDKDRPMFASVT